MSKTFTLLTTAALAATLIASSGVAHAQPLELRNEAAPSETVRYGDLDIDHAAGAEILLRRISLAATRVCGGQPDARAWGATRAFATCRQTTIARAVTRVGAPALQARHEARYVELAKR